MKVNLTDGKSLYSFYINADMDAADHAAVRRSGRPVTTALHIIKKRIGEEVFAGLYPAPGVVVEGLN